MKSRIGIAAFTICALFSGAGIAQNAPEHNVVLAQAGTPTEGPVVIMHSQSGDSGAGSIFVQSINGPALPPITVGGTEFLFEGKPVVGAPFSADAVTETVQMLADGNRITNSSSTKLFRDSQGRTRRELGSDAQTMTVLPFPGPKMSHPEVMISDPVAGVSYTLDSKSRTAMKLPLPRHAEKIVRGPEHAEAGSATSPNQLPKAAMPEHKAGFIALQSGDNMIFRTNMAGEMKSESLGKQTIEGVEAEGQRVTETIPAGQIGNELPIVSTTETWFSPRLQRLILSKRHDPRFGDTTFKLTNISLDEPSPSLFQVPSDFTITDPKTEAERMRKESEQMRKQFERMKPQMDQMRKQLERMKPQLDQLKSQSEQMRHQMNGFPYSPE